MENKFIIFGLITICWILGTISFGFNVDVPQSSSKNFEIAKLIFLSIGAYGVIMATYFNIYNTLESTQNIKEQINFSRIENSFNLVERWDTPSLKEARDLTREIAKDRHTIADADLMGRISKGKDLERSVITTFNFWEGIYISIQHKRVDECLLKETFSAVYCDMFKRFEVWIKTIDPTVKKHLEKLYDLWSS